MNKHSFIVLIPARGGSKGLKKKIFFQFIKALFHGQLNLLIGQNV